jgi:hypothetical protein
MGKRTNLAYNSKDSSYQSPPCSPPATSTIDLHEFSSLLSEMMDPAASALIHRKRRRRAVPARVSFAEDAFLYPSDRRIEDVQPSWYTEKELAVFKKDRKGVVRVLKRSNFDTNAVDKKKYCLRGYEPYFSMEMNKAVKYARETLYAMVFSEQQRQKMLNIYEPEIIRDCSCNASEWARGNARELGVLDALESFALTLNLDALRESMDEDNDTGTGIFTGIILPKSMSRQAKEQEKSRSEKDIKIRTTLSSVPGAYHVDHAPVSQEQDKDTKMRGNEGSSSRPGAYRVDYPAAYHMNHEPVVDHRQQALQFINF